MTVRDPRRPPGQPNPPARGLRSSRRDFLRSSLGWGATLVGMDLVRAMGGTHLLRALGGPGGPGPLHLRVLDATALAAEPLEELLAASPRARYWTTLPGGDGCTSCHNGAIEAGTGLAGQADATIHCLLCAQGCLLAPGQRGRCRARINAEGELRTLVYGRPITVHVDPVEKGPFYHFLPGRRTLTLATAGCPLSCKFCQNWHISQARPEDRHAPFTAPGAIVTASEAKDLGVVTFTYNEPTVYVEYLTDVARAAREDGLRTAIVSCGLMTESPLAEMCETVDAIKIDLKGFSEDFYHEVCQARLAPVLRSIRQVARSSAHLEIVNLVVPTLNDSDAMLERLVEWVMGEVGPDVPLHFTRFSPAFQLENLPPTPLDTLTRARDLALARGLRYVYVGNAPGHEGNSTYCPGCGECVIQRTGFFVQESHLDHGTCRSCGQTLPGVWT